MYCVYWKVRRLIVKEGAEKSLKASNLGCHRQMPIYLTANFLHGIHSTGVLKIESYHLTASHHSLHTSQNTSNYF